MGYPKYMRHPLRPIVSRRGSTTYEVANHIKNTGDFIEQIKGITLLANECITSYDVLALFTSVPTDPAINTIRRRLELDQEPHSRTTMKVEHIISLLEFCFKNTYFQFKGRFYEQIQGAAMGSPISPILANLFMKDFEVMPNALQDVEEVCG